ncbi:MAG: hypothetical protein FWH27_08460 [Planctomycetaceae bacterium]|nr:hypothetical protein [Planctomycetaceae bacterium]
MSLSHFPIKFVFVALILFCLATVDAAELVSPNGAKEIDGYVTSWIGNSYGGLNNGKGRWVQQDIAAMCVTPDGTVYTNVPWEEAGGNCMMYKDGEMLGAAMHTHGWGFNGGKAVAVNDKYVYIALVGNNEGGGLVDAGTWPPKGKRWFGVSRRLRSDFTKGAPFDHGKGGKGDTLPKCFLVVNEVPDDNSIDGQTAITGLWADNERLYVANPLENRVEIYDAETMLKIEQWPLPDEFQGKAGSIALDTVGNLWMLVQRPRESLLAERFLVFDRNGKLFTKRLTNGKTRHCPIEIPENHEENFPHNYHPSAFCFDNEGRLLVADTGIWQVILVFEKNGWDYVPSPIVIGWPMIAMRPGIYSDMIFRNITAIGCDAQGNVYVASDWATSGGGTILESYAPVSEPVELTPPTLNHFSFTTELLERMRWKLNWRLYGLCFIDCATLDPDDETIAYTKEERYKIDWSQEPGKEWTLLDVTAFRPNANFKTDTPQNDWKDFFRDPRLNIGDSAPVWVRNLDGKKFLFVSDMNAVRLQVYELDFTNERNVIRAAVLFSPQRYRMRDGSEPVDWLSGQPARGEWIWTNSLSHGGQLFMDAKEFSSQEPEVRDIEGWFIEPNGDIWQTTHNQGLRRFRYQGLDSIGNPVWNFENMDVFPHPAEFTQVKRIRYDAETDTLYLGGCATVDGVEHRNQHWKPMGAVICRYDNFLQGDNPGTTDGKLRWRIVAPYVTGSQGHESCEPMGFDTAGDYLFVPYTGASKTSGFATGHVEVFRLSDGNSVGWMEPDPATVGEIGLQDIRECLSAHRRANGEYVIFLEDDYKAKVVMFRWKP